MVWRVERRFYTRKSELLAEVNELEEIEVSRGYVVKEK